MNWPIGMGKGLEGLYDIHNQRVEIYRPESHGGERLIPFDQNGEIPQDHPLNQNGVYQQVLEEVELLQEAGDSFDEEKIARGDQTPVFWLCVNKLWCANFLRNIFYNLHQHLTDIRQ